MEQCVIAIIVRVFVIVLCSYDGRSLNFTIVIKLIRVAEHFERFRLIVSGTFLYFLFLYYLVQTSRGFQHDQFKYKINLEINL